MIDTAFEQALKTLEPTFKDRLRRLPPMNGETERGGALASVLPLHAEEVELLARVARRYSLPLVALGAGTAPGSPLSNEVFWFAST